MIIKYILEMESEELNKKDHNGNTPLMLSVKLCLEKKDYFEVFK
jgi:hypothetical protein